jgi:hypothetical protein
MGPLEQRAPRSVEEAECLSQKTARGDYSCRDDQSSAARITEVRPITRPTIQPATSWPTSTAPRSTAMPMIPPVATSRMVARSILVRRRSRPGSIPPSRSRRRASRSRWRAWRDVSSDSGSVKDRSPDAGASPDCEDVMAAGYPDWPATTSLPLVPGSREANASFPPPLTAPRRRHPLAKALLLYCALGTGANVSSSARSWKLRSSSSGDAEAPPHGCRAIRPTWRMPPHRQRVAEDPLREAKPSL